MRFPVYAERLTASTNYHIVKKDEKRIDGPHLSWAAIVRDEFSICFQAVFNSFPLLLSFSSVNCQRIKYYIKKKMKI